MTILSMSIKTIQRHAKSVHEEWHFGYSIPTRSKLVLSAIDLAEFLAFDAHNGWIWNQNSEIHMTKIGPWVQKLTSLCDFNLIGHGNFTMHKTVERMVWQRLCRYLLYFVPYHFYNIVLMTWMTWICYVFFAKLRIFFF